MRNLSSELLEKEKITTTLAKAKELRRFAERLVTLSKKETLHARRQVLRHIHRREVVSKLFDTLSARYAQRPGGYTRIVKLGPRRGDHAEMAVIELVGSEPVETESKKPKKKAADKPKTKKAAAPSPSKKGDAEGGATKASTAKKQVTRSTAGRKGKS